MNLTIDDVIQIMKSGFPEKGCIYLSTPITGGMNRITNVSSVIDKNALEALKAESLIVSDYIIPPRVINPAKTFIPEFSQEQYLELWIEVIRTFANKLWVMPDFYLSDGCVAEVCFAIENHIPVHLICSENGIYFDADKPSSTPKLIQMILDGVSIMQYHSIPTDSHKECLRRLNV